MNLTTEVSTHPSTPLANNRITLTENHSSNTIHWSRHRHHSDINKRKPLSSLLLPLLPLPLSSLFNSLVSIIYSFAFPPSYCPVSTPLLSLSLPLPFHHPHSSLFPSILCPSAFSLSLLLSCFLFYIPSLLFPFFFPHLFIPSFPSILYSLPCLSVTVLFPSRSTLTSFPFSPQHLTDSQLRMLPTLSNQLLVRTGYMKV